MREVVERALPLGGPVLVALTFAMWARYFLIRFGDDEEVARLRVPLVLTGSLVAVLVVVMVLEEPPS